MRRKKIAEAYELAVSPSLEDVRRFLDKCEEVDGHWMWRGRLDENGYGRFDYQGTNIGAHRFSYAVFRGVVPKGRQIHHENSCRHHSCVHPCCLRPLTRRRNSAEGARHRAAEPKLF